MFQPPGNSSAAEARTTRWRNVSQTVKKLNALKNGIKSKHSQMETLENKFCSTDSQHQLDRSSSQLPLQRAAYYTKPSQQMNGLGVSSRSLQLPPLSSSAARLTSLQSGKAIQKRIKRRRSILPGHVLSHQGSNIALTVTPRVFSDEVGIGIRRTVKCMDHLVDSNEILCSCLP